MALIVSKSQKCFAIFLAAMGFNASLPAPANAQVTVNIDCGSLRVGGGSDRCSGTGFSFLTPGQTVSIQLPDSAATSFVRGEIGSIGVRTSVDGTGAVSSRLGAHAEGTWYDQIYFDPFGFLPGEMVRVRVTQIIDIHELTAELDTGNYASSGIVSRFSAPLFTADACGVAEFNLTGNPALGYCSPYQDKALRVGRNYRSYDFDMAPGVNNLVYGRLSSASGLTSGNTHLRAMGSASADAANTAHTYFTVLTPGVTLVSQSGHTYTLPALGSVPEPDSWAMLLFGFAATGLALRNCRRTPLRAAKA
jgi:hypothetical protein